MGTSMQIDVVVELMGSGELHSWRHCREGASSKAGDGANFRCRPLLQLPSLACSSSSMANNGGRLNHPASSP
jgi:hypothetical protein